MMWGRCWVQQASQGTSVRNYSRKPQTRELAVTGNSACPWGRFTQGSACAAALPRYAQVTSAGTQPVLPPGVRERVPRRRRQSGTARWSLSPRHMRSRGCVLHSNMGQTLRSPHTRVRLPGASKGVTPFTPPEVRRQGPHQPLVTDDATEVQPKRLAQAARMTGGGGLAHVFWPQTHDTLPPPARPSVYPADTLKAAVYSTVAIMSLPEPTAPSTPCRRQ